LIVVRLTVVLVMGSSSKSIFDRLCLWHTVRSQPCRQVKRRPLAQSLRQNSRCHVLWKIVRDYLVRNLFDDPTDHNVAGETWAVSPLLNNPKLQLQRIYISDIDKPNSASIEIHLKKFGRGPWFRVRGWNLSQIETA
jgi:hypothetical protein